MIKVSITLPNNAQITFESEEPEVIHEVVGMVLRDLPRELMQSTVHANGDSGGYAQLATSQGEARTGLESASPGASPEATEEVPGRSTEKESPAPSTTRSSSDSDTAPKPQRARRGLTDDEQDFVTFCQQANPLGDMRRVVVAAEGANRYLGRESVDAAELGRLFDLVGWQRPHSFVQTLRNAGRSKFRWLERVPGRSGQYRVTDLGRSTALIS